MTHELQFSNDWFVRDYEGRRKTSRESTKQLWQRLLLTLEPRPKRILEIGLCEGRSTLWLLENLQPELWLGIDPWKPDRRFRADLFKRMRDNFWHNMGCFADQCTYIDLAAKVSALTAILAARRGQRGTMVRISLGGTDCHVVEQASQDYLRWQVDADQSGNPFDLVIIDGDHSAPGTLMDSVLSWRKLAIGGLLIFDDAHRRWHNGRPTVREAVLAFYSCFEHCVHKVLETKYQWWFRRWR